MHGSTCEQATRATRSNDADVMVSFSLTDVRRRSNLADYTGEVQLAPTVRITDENNGPSGTEAATVGDIRFRMTAVCAATADPDRGYVLALEHLRLDRSRRGCRRQARQLGAGSLRALRRRSGRRRGYDRRQLAVRAPGRLRPLSRDARARPLPRGDAPIMPAPRLIGESIGSRTKGGVPLAGGCDSAQLQRRQAAQPRDSGAARAPCRRRRRADRRAPGEVQRAGLGGRPARGRRGSVWADVDPGREARGRTGRLDRCGEHRGEDRARGKAAQHVGAGRPRRRAARRLPQDPSVRRRGRGSRLPRVRR